MDQKDEFQLQPDGNWFTNFNLKYLAQEYQTAWTHF